MFRLLFCNAGIKQTACQQVRTKSGLRTGEGLRWSCVNNGVGSKVAINATTNRITNSSCRRFYTLVQKDKVTSKIPWFRGRLLPVVFKQGATIRLNSSKVAETSAKLQVAGKTTTPKSSEVKRLLSLASPERWRLTGAIGLLVVSSAVTISVPFFMGKMIDIIYSASQDGQMVEKLTALCTFLVGVFIVGGLANFGRVYFMMTAGQRIVRRIRHNIFSSVMKQEVAFFDKTKTGELVNRLSTDTSLVGTAVTLNISDGLRSVAQAIGGVGMMFYVSPKLACVALCIVPPVAIMSRFYGRFVRGITKNVQDSLASATQVAEERISNIRTVRAFSQEALEVEAYDKKIDGVLKLQHKEALAQGVFWGSTGLSGNLIILSVLYYGGLMMSESQITVGDLSSFLLYAAYVGVSVGGLTSFYTELNRGLGASVRLFDLMNRTPTIPLTNTNTLSHLEGNIDFNTIAFRYPSREDVSIFSGLSLSIPAGSSLAVVGPSGSGKSTLASLLLRLYDPNQGQVLLDGKDIKDLSPTWLRQQIGTVSQEPILFSSSVSENIAYGAVDPSSVTTEQIIEAAKKANAHNFINNFPEGYNTLVGERGLMLSGGQRQRIAIARAILKNPKILVLDEATSALDAESEFLVQDALDKVMVGRTVIIIAHRLSTIRNADRIAVLDQGTVTELGTYDQLMTLQDGMFRKLVERQTIVSQ